MATETERYDLGRATLAAITGGTGGAVVESLKDIAPDLAEWIISFSYGEGVARGRYYFATINNKRMLCRSMWSGSEAQDYYHFVWTMPCDSERPMLRRARIDASGALHYIRMFK